MIWAWWVAVAVAWAGEVSFTGTWVLDPAVSDDDTPVLLAQGVPAWQATIARQLGVTQVIEDKGARLEVLYKASIFRERHDEPLDGQVRTERNKRGDDQTLVHVRSDGGVRTTVRFTMPDGAAATLVSVRTLAADGTMVITSTLSIDGQPDQVFRRVFRKEA